MSQILLLEDDPILGLMLKRGLELERYKVAWMKDIKSAEAAISSEQYDLFILDWNLPDGAGLSVCEKIRAKSKDAPVVFLTAKTEEEFAIEAFTAGATDFLRKPCGQAELVARVRRYLGQALVRETTLRFDELTIHTGQRKAMFRGQDVPLSRKELDILEYFVRHPEIVVSRESLLAAIDADGNRSDRAIDTQLSRLRARLREAGIKSVEIKSIYGEGYRLTRV